jgi:hypothetical protein
MGWISWASDVPVQGAPRADTIINGAASEARHAAGSGAIQCAAPAAGADTQISEEIRRRQRSLLTRYVVSARAR